jgi:hypothetical protein
MFTRRLLIEYLLMVGVPLILLIGVLHRGRALEAPAEVEGDWKLALNSSAVTNAPCGPILRDVDGSAISISQSGSFLTASMSNSEHRTLRGRSEGSELWLESVRHDDPAMNNDLLRLTGAVSEARSGRLIRGALLMPRSVGCPPLAFEATSQSRHGVRERTAER